LPYYAQKRKQEKDVVGPDGNFSDGQAPFVNANTFPDSGDYQLPYYKQKRSKDVVGPSGNFSDGQAPFVNSAFLPEEGEAQMTYGRKISNKQ
jgi:hypothetical protein